MNVLRPDGLIELIHTNSYYEENGIKLKASKKASAAQEVDILFNRLERAKRWIYVIGRPTHKCTLPNILGSYDVGAKIELSFSAREFINKQANKADIMNKLYLLDSYFDKNQEAMSNVLGLYVARTSRSNPVCNAAVFIPADDYCFEVSVSNNTSKDLLRCEHVNLKDIVTSRIKEHTDTLKILSGTKICRFYEILGTAHAKLFNGATHE